jgi:hypothetical protein
LIVAREALENSCNQSSELPMLKPWFRARTYGWGWTPSSTEGWIVVAVSLILVLGGTAVFMWRIQTGADPRIAGVLFVLWIVLVGGGLTAVAWATGEPPHWRWG